MNSKSPENKSNEVAVAAGIPEKTISSGAARTVSFPVRVWRFYLNGFRSMTWGRTLWLIILIKLFIMFAILKVFFFPDFLARKTEAEKQDYVGSELTGRSFPVSSLSLRSGFRFGSEIFFGYGSAANGSSADAPLSACSGGVATARYR